MRICLIFFKKNISQVESSGLLFLHIPKTAGTSFRVAADNSERGLKIYADYGNRPSSSRLIRKCYKDKDFSPVATISNQRTILVGHFFLRRYARHYPVQNVISFVREPVQRVLSHYHYMIRTDRYKGSLESFIKDSKYQNVQSRPFSKFPIEAIGFIGLTEKYNESLELINTIYALNIPVKNLNKNKEKPDEPYDASQNIIGLIKEQNQADMQLYEKVCQLFLTRQQVETGRSSYIFGKIDVMNDKEISGWAFDPGSSEPVKLNLHLNNNVVTQLNADTLRSDLKKMNVPRNAKVGFSYLFNNNLALSGNLEVRVADSNQLITI
ncbi:MAG: hypothetical protein ACI9XC_002399 [Gammaproteobacteria bacterium]|jgi:hypothetical protein